MLKRRTDLFAFGFALLAAAAPASAQVSPHLALYTMSLGNTRGDSGVVEARGTMAYRWGETCDGWTIEQRYRLKLRYAENADVDIESNFVTWESKDGRRYHFNQKETRNGEVSQEVRGEAHLDGPAKGGAVDFAKPQAHTMTLAPGVLFPSAHTLLLIDKARHGENFVSRHVFDGSADENASQVSAVIGAKLDPDAEAKKNPLLNRPGWRMRLAFFPVDPKVEKPDYELGMQMLDNGVSRDMLIDYGDYSIRAKLDDIEAVARPNC